MTSLEAHAARVEAVRAALAPALPGGHLPRLPDYADPITRLAERAVTAVEDDDSRRLLAAIADPPQVELVVDDVLEALFRYSPAEREGAIIELSQAAWDALWNREPSLQGVPRRTVGTILGYLARVDPECDGWRIVLRGDQSSSEVEP